MIVRWRAQGWTGWLDLAAGINPIDALAAASKGEGRVSRHARTIPLGLGSGALWLKVYPPPDGRRAERATRMGVALRTEGFVAPAAVLLGRCGRAGLLVTRDVGGEPLLDAVTRCADSGAALRGRRRQLLRELGRSVGRLHGAGFVAGDLVPSNVHVRGDGFAFLDHDRTRRSRLLVRFAARRNLVQLGRFVVPGLGLSDRARVLHAYAETRGFSRRMRHRLALWVVAKTMRRRCAIDRIPADVAARAGFAALMRSGGQFDPTRVRDEGRA